MIDLENIGMYRENNRLEAKRAQGGLPGSIWETYSAFANTYGGVILLGVVEQKDKSFKSVLLPDPYWLADEFWEGLETEKKASVNILSREDIQVVESGGNHIVVIQVPRADRRDRPVYIGEDPFSGTYRRSGDGDYHCSPEEVREMLRDRDDTARDLRLISPLEWTALERDSIGRYTELLVQKSPEYAGLDTRTLLCRVSAAGEDEAGAVRPTAAGLLMFGREPDIVREYPHYHLEYREKTDEQSEERVCISSDSGSWSGNVFDFYFMALERLRAGIGEMGEAKSVTDALKEVLVNTLTHANYFGRRGLVIKQTGREILLTNPGSFRVNIDGAIRGGVSDARNETLTRMFNLIGIGEHAGRGLPSVFETWKKQNWNRPIICENF
ncbi:MAG: putative DNA binding domain-containing protein, partial [Oscillospiraceae bacterium]|nr:putative DNA binding domain-containing protein [Oscillospiraceae bacterium]